MKFLIKYLTIFLFIVSASVAFADTPTPFGDALPSDVIPAYRPELDPIGTHPESARGNITVQDIANRAQPSVIGAEPTLGNPPVDGMTLTSTSSGIRSWSTAGAGDMLGASNLSEITDELVARGNLTLGTSDSVEFGSVSAEGGFIVPQGTQGQVVQLYEAAVNGTNYVGITAANALTTNLVTNLSDTTGPLSTINGSEEFTNKTINGTNNTISNLTASQVTTGNSLRTDAIEFVIGDGANVITTGNKGVIEVPYNCTIKSVALFADQTGSIILDVWKDAYVNYSPVAADTITASAKPTLSGASKYKDVNLVGWTTALSAGDVLVFNVDSASIVKRVTISLTVEKN